MKPLFVFDFDGTICDSTGAFIVILNILAESYKFKKVSEGDMEELRSLPSKQLPRYLGIKAWKLPLMIREARTEMEKRIETMKPYPGYAEVFEELERLEIPTWILTSNSRANVDSFLRKEKLRVGRVFAESSFFGKGNLLRSIIKREKIDPQTPIVYIGDETRDIEAARKAGTFAAAVTWGYASEKVLNDHEPDFLLREPKDIFALLKLKVERLHDQKGLL